MHRYTKRPCAWRISRQLHNSGAHIQSVSTASAVSTKGKIGNGGGDKELVPHNVKKKKSSEGTQDIILKGDIIFKGLSATLEAHRAHNRASVIRKIEAEIDNLALPFDRPLLQNDLSGDVDTASQKGQEVSGIEDSRLGDGLQRSPDVGKIECSKHCEKDGVGGTSGLRLQNGRLEDEITDRQWPADTVQGKQEDARLKRQPGFVKDVGPQEYTGMAMHIPKSSWDWRKRRPYEIQRPWLPYAEDSSGNKYERLSNEIRAFEAYMKLSPAEEAAAQAVIAEMTSIVQNILPGNSLTLLGSRSTGLAQPLSDFDFSVDMGSLGQELSEANQTRNSKAIVKASLPGLRKLEKGLRHSKETFNTELVIARVPIVRCTHRATGLDIQFQTMSPLRSAQEYTAAYLAELPSLRPLYIVISHFLGIRDLTTVFLGGVGSYTILMMIVTFLKHSSGRFAPNDIGGQLLHLLNFYGKANLYESGFSANPPRTFPKIGDTNSTPEMAMQSSSDPQLQGIQELQKINPRKPYLLALQDPANPFNDLGKASYAIKHIQATFNRARTSLLDFLYRLEAQRPLKWSALECMVRDDYVPFELARHKIETAGTPGRNHIVNIKAPPTNDVVTRLLERRLRTYKGLPQAAEEDEPDPSSVTEQNPAAPLPKTRRKSKSQKSEVQQPATADKPNLSSPKKERKHVVSIRKVHHALSFRKFGVKTPPEPNADCKAEEAKREFLDEAQVELYPWKEVKVEGEAAAG